MRHNWTVLPGFGRTLSLVAGTIVLVGAAFAADTADISARPAEVRKTEASYSVLVGLDNEIFPVFANHASLQKPDARSWGTVAVNVTNSSDSVLRTRMKVQVLGWSDEEIQLVTVGPGEVRTILFAPTFLPRTYENSEIVAATAMVQVADLAGRTLFSAATPVRLRAADDMMWGRDFKFAPFIASWVTPHDDKVEQVLTVAKEFMPGRRLPGYEDWKSDAEQKTSTYLQSEAIYHALQKMHLSYVKSSVTFGGHDMAQRIRMPHLSIEETSANCIDGVVLYASLLENLGMDADVVLVPGHAYVGVRNAKNGDDFLYFDTALTGRAEFSTAVELAQKGLGRWGAKDITHIYVTDARRAGIYPMPQPIPDWGRQELARGK